MSVSYRGVRYVRASDEADRHARAHPDAEYRLPNVHTIVPAEHMRQVPYRPGQPTITIYRSVPAGVAEIRPGDWVALTRAYAQSHGRGTLLSKVVPVAHVAWAGTDMNEWFYAP
jgi:hypothetical protein